MSLPVLRDVYEDFSAIEIAERTRPVIGVVGEIYIRSNRFSNEDVVRQIERLGGEAWVAPISEWILYVNATAKVSAKMNRSWNALLKAYMTGMGPAQGRAPAPERFQWKSPEPARAEHRADLAQCRALHPPFLRGRGSAVRGQGH